MGLALGRKRRESNGLPLAVAVDDRLYWQRAERRQRPVPASEAAPAANARLRVVPRRGVLAKDAGRAPSLPTPEVWQTTTAAAADLYSFLVAEPMPPVGVPVGVDVHTRSTFCCHLAEWVLRGFITNPNLDLTAKPGAGKSALVKKLILGLVPFGVKSLVLGDIKGEYNWLARFLGVSPVVLGPGSKDRLNPLDGGPLAKGLPVEPSERAERLAEVHRRRLMLLKTLIAYRLGRPVTTEEEAAVGLALRRATGEDRQGALRDPVLQEVLSELWSLTDEDAWEIQMGSKAALIESVRQAGLALHNLLSDTLGGIFDGPTTVPIDFSAPIQTVDVSRVEARGDEALALVLSCLSSWGQAAVDDPGRSGSAPSRLVVRDELWRALRDKALVAKVDADLRLSRAQGTMQVICTHRLADLEAAADPEVARHLLASCDVHVLMAQDLGEVRHLGDELGLSPAEAEMVSSWTAAHVGRGLWRVGRSRAYVVQGTLHPTEQRLFYTNEKMA